MRIWSTALALLAFVGAFAAVWFLLDEAWAAPIGIALGLTSIVVSVVQHRRSGEPWVSKNPDDYY